MCVLSRVRRSQKEPVILQLPEIDNYDEEEVDENQSEFQGIKDHVAVGIGPLFYEQDYVEKGEPDPRLKGDMRFTVERMLVKCAPYRVETPTEKNPVTSFIRDERPNPTEKDWERLSKRFLSLVAAEPFS
jgi:hypothetical protein